MPSEGREYQWMGRVHRDTVMGITVGLGIRLYGVGSSGFGNDLGNPAGISRAPKQATLSRTRVVVS